MTDFDDVIHQSARLRIMTALDTIDGEEWLEFVKLKAITGMTDGNLAAHLDTLNTASYVEMTKQFVGKKPQTRIRMTVDGKSAYRKHIAALKLLLDMR